MKKSYILTFGGKYLKVFLKATSVLPLENDLNLVGPSSFCSAIS